MIKIYVLLFIQMMFGGHTSSVNDNLTSKIESPLIKVTFQNKCGRKIHLAVTYLKSYNPNEPNNEQSGWETKGFYTLKNKESFTINSASQNVYYYAYTDVGLLGTVYFWQGPYGFQLYGETYGFLKKDFSDEYKERKWKNYGSHFNEPYIITFYKKG